MMKPIEIEGHVTRTRVSPGSKSDRLAVVLVTDDGRLILRRKGSDSYTGQEALLPLVGKRIRAYGSIAHGHFFMERYESLEPKR